MAEVDSVCPGCHGVTRAGEVVYFVEATAQIVLAEVRGRPFHTVREIWEFAMIEKGRWMVRAQGNPCSPEDPNGPIGSVSAWGQVEAAAHNDQLHESVEPIRRNEYTVP